MVAASVAGRATPGRQMAVIEGRVARCRPSRRNRLTINHKVATIWPPKHREIAARWSLFSITRRIGESFEFQNRMIEQKIPYLIVSE